MKPWLWLVVVILGLSLMIGAYRTRFQPDPGSPWAHGFIIFGSEKPDKAPQKLSPKSLPGLGISARVRLLPGTSRVEKIIKAMSSQPAGNSLNLLGQLRPKLIELSFASARIDASRLQSGRLPEPDRNEVVAGAGALKKDSITVGDRNLVVVGVLKSDAFLFLDCYLIPPSSASERLLPAEDAAVHQATLVGLTPAQFRNRKSLKEIVELFPAPKYTTVMPMARVSRQPYYLYLAGQAMFLLGGSGVLIGFFRWLARRLSPPVTVAEGFEEPGEALAILVAKLNRPGWFAAPLVEMARRPRLVWAVHLVYFGLVFVGAVIVYELPEVQTILMSSVQAQISGKQPGPLALAGAAYGSGNIPKAAAVTFVVNFFLGSLLCITLPSMIVPGLGILVGVIRPLLWGFLLGPTTVIMSLMMIPHSGTMLLEGEGYLLAVLFGLLVPVYLVQPSVGGRLASRLRRALLLNLQACGLVALVLGVAAIYEAVEVIWMAS